MSDCLYEQPLSSSPKSDWMLNAKCEWIRDWKDALIWSNRLCKVREKVTQQARREHVGRR